jgi:hypothetical protein
MFIFINIIIYYNYIQNNNYFSEKKIIFFNFEVSKPAATRRKVKNNKTIYVYIIYDSKDHIL